MQIEDGKKIHQSAIKSNGLCTHKCKKMRKNYIIFELACNHTYHNSTKNYVVRDLTLLGLDHETVSFMVNIEDTRNKRNEHEEDNEGKNDTNYLMLDCNKIHVCQKII